MGRKKTYKPQPIDTSAVVLDEEILALTETLARNTHDVWALRKLAEGWKPGKTLSNEQMTTPHLVPYEDLPEEIKQYDRSTAVETLKLIIALGYEVRKAE